MHAVGNLKRRVEESKAAKMVTTAAKLSKNACSGAKQGLGASF